MMNNKGFTLMELMVATAVSVIVGGTSYVVYSNAFQFQISQARQVDMQATLRMTSNAIGRDIRNAGYGVIMPFSGKLLSSVGQPVGGTDGTNVSGSTNPDPVNVSDTLVLKGGYKDIGELGIDAPKTATALSMADALSTNELAVNDQITVGGFYQGTVTAIDADRTTLTISPGLDRDYSSRNTVSIIQQITYAVADYSLNRTQLNMRPAGSVVAVAMADPLVQSGAISEVQVEAMQVTFLMDNATGTPINTESIDVVPTTGFLPDEPAGTEVVGVSLLLRSLDSFSSDETDLMLPTMEIEDAVTVTDDFQRRWMTITSEVPNVEIQDP